MKRPYIAKQIRQRIAEKGRHRCAYCQTQQNVIGQTLHIEHIIPIVKGGSSEEANLCSACQMCNSYKGVQTEAIDPQTEDIVSLFHPNTQSWVEHFQWQEAGAEIIGRTAIGRATVEALNLNHPLRCYARRKWIIAGWHPPKD